MSNNWFNNTVKSGLARVSLNIQFLTSATMRQQCSCQNPRRCKDLDSKL